MASGNQPNLLDVDWSKIPAPPDDGAARHLEGMAVPDVALTATDGTQVSLAKAPGPRRGVCLSAHRACRARSRWSTTGT